MKLGLKVAGALLCFCGLAHVFSFFFAHDSPFVTWPDALGPFWGWTVRIAMIVGGGALLLVSSRSS
jgi:hypothetical protein